MTQLQKLFDKIEGSLMEKGIVQTTKTKQCFLSVIAYGVMVFCVPVKRPTAGERTDAHYYAYA